MPILPQVIKREYAVLLYHREGERVTHVVKQSHYNLLEEIGYTFGNSVSLAVLG